MFIIFGAAICLLGLYICKRKQIDNYNFYDGAITKIDPDKKTIDVKYTVCKQTYDASFNAVAHFMANEIPEVGLKVQVITKNDDIEHPVDIQFMRQMGKGHGSKRNFIDYNREKGSLPVYLIGIAFIICGLINLFI